MASPAPSGRRSPTPSSPSLPIELSHPSPDSSDPGEGHAQPEASHVAAALRTASAPQVCGAGATTEATDVEDAVLASEPKAQDAASCSSVEQVSSCWCFMGTVKDTAVCLGLGVVLRALLACKMSAYSMLSIVDNSCSGLLGNMPSDHVDRRSQALRSQAFCP